jgi:hypothetical protein
MKISKLPTTIINLVQPAVVGLAMRLFVLTEGRKGKAKAKPNVLTFYETGIVHSLFETMLMSPALDNWQIRVEEKQHGKWVDLWLRDVNGGDPVRIEAGDLYRGKPDKVNSDAQKLKDLNVKSKARSSWFLALVRDLQVEIEENRTKKQKRSANDKTRKLPLDSKRVLVARIKKSTARNGGIDPGLVEFDERLVRVFSIYRPGAKGDLFGVILFKVKT